MLSNVSAWLASSYLPPKDRHYPLLLLLSGSGTYLIGFDITRQHTFKFGHTVTSRITDVFTPEACVATRLNLPDSPPWTITVTAPTTWLGAINNEPYISYTRTFDPAHDYLVAEEVEITQYITAETVTECSPWVTAVATKTISSDSSFSTANGTPSITVIDVSSESSPNRLNSGQIAGLIVGSVAGFLLELLGCAYFFGKIWRNRVNRNVARRERTRIVIDLADISRPETPPPPYEVAVGMRPSSREQ